VTAIAKGCTGALLPGVVDPIHRFRNPLSSCTGALAVECLTQPETACDSASGTPITASLSPGMIATANPGYMLQLAASGRYLGYDWPVFHPIELIDASIRGVDPRTSMS
jgi:hypothetical protein